jgi:hypothetical protein
LGVGVRVTGVPNILVGSGVSGANPHSAALRAARPLGSGPIDPLAKSARIRDHPRLVDPIRAMSSPVHKCPVEIAIRVTEQLVLSLDTRGARIPSPDPRESAIIRVSSIRFAS